MNKKVLTLLSTAFLASTLLVGCNRNNGGNNSGDDTSSGGSSGSSSSSEVAKIEDWPADLKTLLQTWCGEILPVAPLKAGDLEYDVTEDWYGEEYLEIYDNATANYLAGYDSQLATVGWTITTDSNGDKVAKKKSADGLHAYEVDIYYYQGYGNCLDCYHSVMVNTKTENTAWTAEESAVMVSALTEAIPFMQFGSDYEVVAQGDQFQLSDSYYQDLSADYITILESNGYVHSGVDQYGDPIYKKTLADQSVISLTPYYTNGNYVYGEYTPKTTTSETWPSDVFTAIETASGYDVPQFTASSYEYFVKNGVVTISGPATTSLVETYEGDAFALGYIQYATGTMDTWEETVHLVYGATGSYDDDYNLIIDGFSLTVTPTEPESDFFTDWPDSKIATYMESKEITVAPVSCSDSYHKKYKVYEYAYDDLYPVYAEEYLEEYAFYIAFEIYTEEEVLEMAAEAAAADAGFYIEVYDLNDSATESYEDSLNAIPWFVNSDAGYAEDATGNCRVDYYSKGGVFLIKVTKGAGKAHEPSFELEKETLSLNPGAEYELKYTRSMVLGVIEWESNNPSVVSVSDSGVLTVDDEAAKGSTATIKATLGSMVRTCIVTVTTDVEMSFADKSLMTKEDANESIWKADTQTMTVTKGESSTGVGNGSYFSNPLRLYDKQVVTFTWEAGNKPSIITLNVNTGGSGKNSAETLTQSVTGATAVQEGNVVTLTVGETAESVSIVVTKVNDSKKQAWLDSAVFSL